MKSNQVKNLWNLLLYLWFPQLYLCILQGLPRSTAARVSAFEFLAIVQDKEESIHFFRSSPKNDRPRGVQNELIKLCISP